MQGSFRRTALLLPHTHANTCTHALPLPSPPPRYAALQSLGEKKQAFNEYIQQRRNEEKEEERKRFKQARVDFIKLLVQSQELRLTHSYRRAKEIFEDEPIWKVGRWK